LKGQFAIRPFNTSPQKHDYLSFWVSMQICTARILATKGIKRMSYVKQVDRTS